MALTLEKATKPLNGNNGATHNQAGTDLPPPPYLGRSVRIVGPHVNVDMNQSPHPKNAARRAGEAALQLVPQHRLQRPAHPRVGAESFRRSQTVPDQGDQPGHKGKVNPKRVAVDDPAAMTRHIKAVAHYMGADVVGIAKAHPTFLYAGSRYVQDGTAEDAYQTQTPEELVRKFPYVIQATTAWDYNKLQAHRHHIGDAAYHVSQMKGVLVLKALEGYIKELGYTALRGVVTPQAAGVAGGIGELGRNGLVINKNLRRPHPYAGPDSDRPAAGGGSNPSTSALRTSARFAANAPTPVPPTASRLAIRWSLTALKNTRSTGSLVTSSGPMCTISGGAVSPVPPSARSPNPTPGGIT